MNVALYILGTSHPLQCGVADLAQASIVGFKDELHRICDEFKIGRIAEEMTAEGLKRYGVNETIAEKVAKSMRIPHHNVDLTIKERRNFSLDEFDAAKAATGIGFADGGGAFREAFNELAGEVRERCWSARILAGKEWPTLFVFGADHVQNVHRLWHRLGIGAVIVHADYEP